MSEETLNDMDVLSYTTAEVEPSKAPPVKVVIADVEYVARCPNDYEYMQMWRQLDGIKNSPLDVDLKTFISFFFRDIDTRDIDIRSRGGDAEINIETLAAVLGALVDYYSPYVTERGKESNRATRRAKKAPARR